MKRFITFGFILISGISVLSANPRNPPQGNSGHGPSKPAPQHQTGPKGKPSPSHSNWNQHHSPKKPWQGHHHAPVITHTPRPVVVHTPRPVIHINVNRPRPVYTTPVYTSPSYSYNNRFDFRDFVYTIRNQKFESDKMSIARQGLYNNNFDTYQIKEILSLLDYEDSRLEFAKDAYFNCIDKQNYFRINDMFKFSSSVHELENFIYARR